MSASNQQTIEAYNQAIDTYIASSPQEVSGELKTWIDGVLHQIERDAAILEVGSGSGKDAAYFSSQGFVVELTDASQGFVDYLRRQGYDARLLNILTDDMGQDYDMIFADAVFLHFTQSELEIVLQKTHRALTSGGLLAFTLKVGSGEETTDRKLDAPRYFRYWQQEEVEQLLTEAGFMDVAITMTHDFRHEGKPDWLYVTAKRN